MSDTPAPIPPAAPSDTMTDLSRLLGPGGMKLAAIGALVLGLLIPQAFVSGLIDERESRQAEARAEVARAWGQAQSILPPLLMVPMRPVATDGRPAPPPFSVAIPAAELTMTATMLPERRRRGLFEAVIYTAHVEFAGRFGSLAGLLPANAEPVWAGAYLLSGVSDLRPVTDAPSLRWGDRPLTMVSDGAGRCGAVEAMRWPLGLEGPPAADTSIAGTLELRGTDSLALQPLARRAQFVLRGAWDTPSYIGAALPVRATTDADGFQAEWASGTAAPVIRLPGEHCATLPLPAGIGVALLEAVPTYRMVNRTAKYATLFVLLAVMTFWLFETMAHIRIHLVQYGLLGLSVVLFPLLLLAIAEPAGFAAAYAVSAAMVMAQASLYTAGVTRRAGLAAICAGVLALLFGFLYVVLQLESMALLAGALGLFAMLSVVMAVTRRLGAA